MIGAGKGFAFLHRRRAPTFASSSQLAYVEVFIAMDTFTLVIELGNDAMQDGADVARLLRQLARKIDSDTFTAANYGVLHDVNGNRVAKWEMA